MHYVNLGDAEGRYPPESQAAIITGVNTDGTVSLKIFYKTGIFDMPVVPYGENNPDGSYPRATWHWPERVE